MDALARGPPPRIFPWRSWRSWRPWRPSRSLSIRSTALRSSQRTMREPGAVNAYPCRGIRGGRATARRGREESRHKQGSCSHVQEVIAEPQGGGRHRGSVGRGTERRRRRSLNGNRPFGAKLEAPSASRGGRRGRSRRARGACANGTLHMPTLRPSDRVRSTAPAPLPGRRLGEFSPKLVSEPLRSCTLAFACNVAQDLQIKKNGGHLQTTSCSIPEPNFAGAIPAGDGEPGRRATPTRRTA